jgi:Rps23 Pro-64 3,4-dihydroxylase Tpa1-like proline 4-hydroxylase
MQAGEDFQLASHHDVAAYAAAYRADGRVHIPNLLRDEDAKRLHEAMLRRTPWEILFIYDGLRTLTMSPWEALSHLQRQEMESRFAQGARTPGRFQARFLRADLSIDGEPFTGPDPDLKALVRFLNGEAFLSFARAVTGDSAIRLTDVHTSWYRPGDFLHRHNDYVPEEEGDRSAAYVLNLTPVWLAEWGGLLNFLRPDGHVDGAFTPAWNALNFLRVPQLHFVSTVAGFVAAPRLSVNGWVRRR